jgi:hypothetical protein
MWNKLRNTWYKIKRIIDWFPLLWKDQDWDYGYLLIILKHKLKRMRDCLNENNIIRDLEKTCKEIDQVIEAIDSYRDDPNDEWTIHWNLHHKNGRNLRDCPYPGACHDASEASMKREQQNWSKIWALLDKYGRNFWD